ncbi:hypothetical protein A5482_003735 [Cyanobacterium sp. IPPAS B-1200]|uniref:hypothetical protein n=1 Tax=Cyanobacterium sp. IPPAS B-1200 TaxID=1562720 RepID=UPI00085254CC|nr:hypothetical protein [Cyanobacterium sp. IPPAS B-1200]OEJ78275.1 hypothetical protein A5482_03295 [Cyanobacterium sp. IPPAS B-1200]
MRLVSFLSTSKLRSLPPEESSQDSQSGKFKKRILPITNIFLNLLLHRRVAVDAVVSETKTLANANYQREYRVS